MPSKPSTEDFWMTKWVGKGSRHGETWFGKAGDIAQQPPVWAGVALALGMGGATSRPAALRGSVCYAAAALAPIMMKPVVGRNRSVGA